MSSSATLVLLAGLVSALADRPVEPDPTIKLAEDLGLDSLDLFDLVFRVEETFEVDVDRDVEQKWKTLGDVAEWVDRRKGQRK